MSKDFPKDIIEMVKSNKLVSVMFSLATQGFVCVHRALDRESSDFSHPAQRAPSYHLGDARVSTSLDPYYVTSLARIFSAGVTCTVYHWERAGLLNAQP